MFLRNTKANRDYEKIKLAIEKRNRICDKIFNVLRYENLNYAESKRVLEKALLGLIERGEKALDAVCAQNFLSDGKRSSDRVD